MAININKIYSYPAYLLFFMMLFAPASYKPIKIILIGLTLLIIVVNIMFNKRGQINIDMRVLGITWFLVLMGLIFMMIGSFNGNPGALTVGTVHVVWPILYLILIMGITSQGILDGIMKTLVFSTIIIEVYILTFVLHSKGTLPSFLYLELDLGQSIGFYGNYMEFNIYSLSSLIFLLPFIFSALCVWQKNDQIQIKKIWLWLALGLGCIVLLLSGRRALFLTTAISPIPLMFFVWFLPKQKKKLIKRTMRKMFALLFVLIIGILIYVQSRFDFDFTVFTQMFKSGFDFTDTSNESSYLRYLQFNALIDGWKEHPLFGAGLGAQAGNVIRNAAAPWDYELQYVAYLFHTGIVGFLCYAFGVIWIFIKGLKMFKRGSEESVYMIPVLVGTFCFLVANATNPYLAKYDYLWVIFLPVGILNYWLLRGKGKTTKRAETTKSEETLDFQNQQLTNI
ncbi:O-antigen ligase family protein [Bacillus toyonensis]|uniref:O-antigen ligase-related domain-containing protein n=1 Tax=Bacillus toyonensis TaxID=155322 RepID=A0A2A8HCN2_9BACI|nr:O-antigen ligase family protein [Bacillus toyonensis]PEQ02661.1 hypothetical protein CN585_19445 [Bacillus toyonensis]